MRNPMHKRIPRMLLHQPAHYVPLFLLLLITIVFCSAFFLVQGSVERLYYDFIDRASVEDGRFTTLSPLSDSMWKRLEEKDIQLEKAYYTEAKDGDANVHLYAIRQKINLPDVISGRLPKKMTRWRWIAIMPRNTVINWDRTLRLTDMKCAW